MQLDKSQRSLFVSRGGLPGSPVRMLAWPCMISPVGVDMKRREYIGLVGGTAVRGQWHASNPRLPLNPFGESIARHRRAQRDRHT